MGDQTLPLPSMHDLRELCRKHHGNDVYIAQELRERWGVYITAENLGDLRGEGGIDLSRLMAIIKYQSSRDIRNLPRKRKEKPYREAKLPPKEDRIAKVLLGQTSFRPL